MSCRSPISSIPLPSIPLRIGGVPEHFNYPWHLALQKHPGYFEFIEQKCGTGEMLTNVKAKSVDIIVALTEGLVADIAKGSNVRLIGTYVESPLCWAISVGKEANVTSVEDLKSKKFGISRVQSGSHLMAYVLANQRGWNEDLTFEVKGSFENLRNSVNDKSTDAFMWETFTTKPFHDSGEIKRIGEITTPWPCFMIATLKETADDRLAEIQHLLALIQEACVEFVKEDEKMPGIIAQTYGLKPEDARQWYNKVRITGADMISEAALERTLSVLIDTKIIPKESNIDDLELYLDTRVCELRRDIKSVKLYSQSELITALYSELRAANLSRGKLTYSDLLPFDQNHYHGVEEVDQAIIDMKINVGDNILNFGSGLGGPARYIAGKHRCNVLAIELQGDLNQTASELTERCQLTDKVTHIAGDFVHVAKHLPFNHFNAICSWNTVLHFIDRTPLFSKCFDILKPGGKIFGADFYALNPLTKNERRILSEDVYCRYLPNEDCYKRDLSKSGFIVSMWNDCTEDWKAYTRERLNFFKQIRETKINVYGEETYNRLFSFYSTIADLFEGGRLGGVRYVALKPTS